VARGAEVERVVSLKGSLWAILQYDIAEEIHLEKVRTLLGAQSPERGPEFRRPSPEYVKFAQAPVVCTTGAVQLPGGETWSCTVKVYDYGVVSISLELPFESNWNELVGLASRWIGSPDIERQAAEVARAHADRIRDALVKPNPEWTWEDYYAVHIREATTDAETPLSAHDLISDFGGRIAQIVRGESVELSNTERHEILQQWLSYYPTDLLVVGWMAALIYDTAEGAAPVLQLLEYANTQLLEFRYYDNWLSGVLAGVHRTLEGRKGVFGRWRIAAEAERLNRIRLDVTELTERIDNSIKFLSDMFYARVYRLAARKIGVNDYRDLVEQKLKTAADLYEAMEAEFHQARGFVLELMVVAILIIELVFLFRGKG
jgi:hypothetical protein